MMRPGKSTREPMHARPFAAGDGRAPRLPDFADNLGLHRGATLAALNDDFAVHVSHRYIITHDPVARAEGESHPSLRDVRRAPPRGRAI
jgi:hypothetical protein